MRTINRTLSSRLTHCGTECDNSSILGFLRGQRQHAVCGHIHPPEPATASPGAKRSDTTHHAAAARTSGPEGAKGRLQQPARAARDRGHAGDLAPRQAGVNDLCSSDTCCGGHPRHHRSCTRREIRGGSAHVAAIRNCGRSAKEPLGHPRTDQASSRAGRHRLYRRSDKFAGRAA